MSLHPEAASETPEVPREILDLAAAVAELPGDCRGRVEPLMNAVLESRDGGGAFSLVQDALSQLRVDMKYLMFDLEATRRERDDYRRQLEQA